MGLMYPGVECLRIGLSKRSMKSNAAARAASRVAYVVHAARSVLSSDLLHVVSARSVTLHVRAGNDQRGDGDIELALREMLFIPGGIPVEGHPRGMSSGIPWCTRRRARADRARPAAA